MIIISHKTNFHSDIDFFYFLTMLVEKCALYKREVCQKHLSEEICGHLIS